MLLSGWFLAARMWFKPGEPLPFGRSQVDPPHPLKGFWVLGGMVGTYEDLSIVTSIPVVTSRVLGEGST